MAPKSGVDEYAGIDMHAMDKGKQSDVATPRGVRPDSPEELEGWRAAAEAQGSSLHQFMLYAVRDLVVRTARGFRIPQEQVTTTQIKRPSDRMESP